METVPESLININLKALDRSACAVHVPLKFKKLALNINKTCYIMMSVGVLDEPPSIVINSECIERVEQAKYLGVILGDRLTLTLTGLSLKWQRSVISTSLGKFTSTKHRYRHTLTFARPFCCELHYLHLIYTLKTLFTHIKTYRQRHPWHDPLPIVVIDGHFSSLLSIFYFYQTFFFISSL